MIFATWNPPADVFFSGNKWVVKVELAGISPEEVEILAQGNTLSVRGRRRDLLVQRGWSCHSLEISYSSFERSIALPARIIPTSIDWEYRHGILRIQFTTQDE